MTQYFDSPGELADAVVEAIGSNIVLGLPVGIGKAIHFANALFERAERDPSLTLTIFTALTLEPPQPGSDLERRFLEPLAERLWGEWPRLRYAEAMRRQSLPPNVRVREFYFRPGAYLGNTLAQRTYTSLNYTQVARELLRLGVNVIGQLVAPPREGGSRYSLGSNPEVTLDLLPELEARRAAGRPVAFVGEVNERMPYLFGDAELDAAHFDFVLSFRGCHYPLFGLPRRAVTDRDFATAMHVASLVPDGGTLQLGIGSLSEALAHCLLLRHRDPEVALPARLRPDAGRARAGVRARLAEEPHGAALAEAPHGGGRAPQPAEARIAGGAGAARPGAPLIDARTAAGPPRQSRPRTGASMSAGR